MRHLTSIVILVVALISAINAQDAALFANKCSDNQCTTGCVKREVSGACQASGGGQFFKYSCPSGVGKAGQYDVFTTSDCSGSAQSTSPLGTGCDSKDGEFQRLICEVAPPPPPPPVSGAALFANKCSDNQCTTGCVKREVSGACQASGGGQFIKYSCPSGVGKAGQYALFTTSDCSGSAQSTVPIGTGCDSKDGEFQRLICEAVSTQTPVPVPTDAPTVAPTAKPGRTTATFNFTGTAGEWNAAILALGEAGLITKVVNPILENILGTANFVVIGVTVGSLHVDFYMTDDTSAADIENKLKTGAIDTTNTAVAAALAEAKAAGVNTVISVDPVSVTKATQAPNPVVSPPSSSASVAAVMGAFLAVVAAMLF